MYKINEVAARFHINANVLRFYEKKKLVIPKRSENNYRLYSVEDIARIQTILLLRLMGFSIASINKLLNENEKPIDLFFHQYDILNQHLHSMNLIRSSLEDCMEELFKHDAYSEAVACKMEETSKILSQMSKWEDKWNFDSWASRYDAEIRMKRKGLDFYKNYDEVLQKSAELVNRHKGLTIDIGVGTGTLSGMLMDQNQVIGVDQSVNMLKEAKLKFPDLKVRLGTFLQLPMNDHIADNIVTSYAFHHCSDDEKHLAIKEMIRVLKADGHIIIADLMFYNQEAKDEFLENCSVEERADAEDEYFALVEELEKMFAALGFTCTNEQVDDLIWIVHGSKGLSRA